MKIQIEVDNRMWELAHLWYKIEKANPFPATTISPPTADRNWLLVFDKRQSLWTNFLKKNKLLKRKKSEVFLGIKIACLEFPQKDEFDKAHKIIQWQEK